MKAITTGLFILLCCCLKAQKPVPAFGEVSLAELQLKNCAFEPGANAMKIFDVQTVSYEPSPFGGKIVTEKRVRIKLFNEKGYPHATVTIPYYSNKKNSKIEELKGRVYSLDVNGKIISHVVEEADFYSTKAMEKVGLIRFTFPHLKPGSIIEYSYILTEKNRLQIDTWQVQSDIPSQYSEATVLVPTFSALRDNTFGNDSVNRKTDIVTKGLDKTKKIYFKENVKSFTPEPYMSSFNDNVLRVGFMLTPSTTITNDYSSLSLWKIPANTLLKSSMYNEQFEKNIPGTDKIIDTAKSFAYTRDKIKYLYHTIKKRFPEKSGNALMPDDIVDAWKSRSGSSAEINFLLMNFLTRAKIPCHAALISTRDNGKINTDFPSFGQLNGVVVFVSADGSNYLLDASSKYQSFNVPPITIVNRQAFLLDPDNIRWVMITDERPLFKLSTDIFASITAEGKIEGGATITYYDYARALLYDSSSNEEDNRNYRSFNKKVPGLKILSDNKILPENEDPALQTIEFDYETANSGDFYFINPQLFASGKINPFSRPGRLTDIDFICNQEIRLTMQLDIPAALKVEELPKNIVVRSVDSSLIFSRMMSVSHSKLSVMQVLEIKKAVFDKSDYSSLYTFFNQVQNILAEEIILKKSN